MLKNYGCRVSAIQFAIFHYANIMCSSNSCFLMSFLTLHWSLKGIIAELGKCISFPFKAMLMLSNLFPKHPKSNFS